MRINRSFNGFTLVENMVTAVIIGVIVTFSLTSLVQNNQKASIDSKIKTTQHHLHELAAMANVNGNMNRPPSDIFKSLAGVADVRSFTDMAEMKTPLGKLRVPHQWAPNAKGVALIQAFLDEAPDADPECFVIFQSGHVQQANGLSGCNNNSVTWDEILNELGHDNPIAQDAFEDYQHLANNPPSATESEISTDFPFDDADEREDVSEPPPPNPGFGLDAPPLTLPITLSWCEELYTPVDGSLPQFDPIKLTDATAAFGGKTLTQIQQTTTTNAGLIKFREFLVGGGFNYLDTNGNKKLETTELNAAASLDKTDTTGSSGGNYVLSYADLQNRIGNNNLNACNLVEQRIVDAEAAINQAAQERDTAITAATSAYYAALEEATKDKQEAINAATAAKNTALAQADDARDTAIAEAAEARDKALAEAQRVRDAIIAEDEINIRAIRDSAIAEAKDARDAAIRIATEIRDNILDAAKALRDAAIAELEADRIAAIAAAKDIRTNAIAEALAQKNESLAVALDVKNAAIAQAANERDAIIAEATRVRDAALQEAIAARDAALQAATTAAQRTAAINAYNRAVSIANTTYNQATNAARTRYNSAVQTANATYNRTANIANATYNSSVSAANVAYNAAVYDANVTRNKAVYNANVAYNVVATTANAARNVAVGAANSAYAIAVNSANTNYAIAYRTTAKTAEANYQKTVTAIQTTYNRQVATADAAYNRAAQVVNTRFNAAVQVANANHTRDVNTATHLRNVAVNAAKTAYSVETRVHTAVLNQSRQQAGRLMAAENNLRTANQQLQNATTPQGVRTAQVRLYYARTAVASARRSITG